jgi:Tfp pilus assembly protein PilO
MIGKGPVAALALVIVLLGLWIVVRAWQGHAEQKAKLALLDGDESRRMAEEYRRLSELAVTAQEHTDLKLAELTQQVSLLRSQLASVQHILTDVE